MEQYKAGDDMDLATEIVARFPIQQGKKGSISKIRKEAFADGALWMRGRIQAPQDISAPFDSVRTSILKYFTTDMKKALIEWMGEYSDMKPAPQQAQAGVWQPIDQLTKDHDLHKVILRYDNGELRRYVENSQPRAVANEFAYLAESPSLPVNLPIEEMIKLSDEDLSKEINKVRARLGMSQRNLTTHEQSVLNKTTERLFRKSLPVKEQIDPVAFAEWINREPYLFGREDYGWFYDIPVEGAGVEHKLIGSTDDLYKYWLTLQNKLL